MRGHPTTAARKSVRGVAAVRGQVPVDQKIKRKPGEERERALAQARWDGHRRSQGAHPEKQMDDVLYHKCDEAEVVPSVG